MKKTALILAGGKGTRLWPLSRENFPKQFVEFKDGRSLFQMAVIRLLPLFLCKDIFIITQENYKFTAYNQIDQIKELNPAAKTALKGNVILEPEPKNTLPAIIFSLKYMEYKFSMPADSLVYVFPSDQMIEPAKKFIQAMRKAESPALAGRMVVFGVKPTHPKEGYGYIIARNSKGAYFMVDKYVEKPPLAVAQKLLAGGAFWNAGIFCFSKNGFLSELKAYQPQIYKYYGLDYEDFQRKFGAIPKVSMDNGIMQNTKKAALVKFDLRWSDLGSWDSILQYYAGEASNFNIGKAEFLDSSDCFTYSGKRLMCMVGLKDVLAIDSSDSVLLIKKGYSDKVRDLVALIEKKGLSHSKDGLTVSRPWGYYTVLHEEKDYKVKEIGVFAGKSLSLQRHKYRSEHWNVVEGRLDALVGSRKISAGRNESIFVPRNLKHKISNPGKKTVKIIEVQIGPRVEESDIERFDAYR
ncbi:MAG: sugar phosphate nucleotidyltransferase [Candidatus Omnitrophota bacterium]|nr:sugar phosphate nucleotidyltransferase [Candidatus Omnitrophota bacterium]